VPSCLVGVYVLSCPVRSGTVARVGPSFLG
jgi:hypothetical protein